MLIARQRSALSGFTYDLLSADGTVIGDLCFPDWAEARNARLKIPAPGRLSSRIDMRLSGTAYTIEFEYTRRGWENDTRYELMKDGMYRGGRRHGDRPSVPPPHRSHHRSLHR